MPYAFSLTTTIPASAQEIYDAWLDSIAHSEMTGSEASMSDEVGAEVSAWDGYITGSNLDLVPGERIVQSWRTTQFADGQEDSIVALTLEEVEGGTLLTLVHSNVPDGQTSYEQGGWQEYYFEPMKEYFANPRREGVGETSKVEPKANRTATRTKSKRAAPKARATAGKVKRRRAGTAKAAPKRAKKVKKKAKKTTKKTVKKNVKRKPARGKK